MSLILDGTNGLSDVDGTAGTPAIRGSDANTGVFFGTDIVGVSTGGSERVRVDASGNVGIGTSSPSASDWNASATVVQSSKNDTNGGLFKASSSNTNFIFSAGNNLAYLATTTNTPITFWTNTTERMRIDSSGNLLVGTTSPIAVSGVDGSNSFSIATENRWAMSVRNSASTSPWGIAVEYSASAPNNTSQNFYWATDTSAQRFSVRSNGGVANYSGNNVNLSDRREKINFAPSKPYLETICAIPVQTFNYIDQNHEEDPGLTLGVVAQDVQEVAPELVMESNWGTAEEPKMRLSVYQTDLQYALMKSLQELKAINDAQAQTIESLTARVVALEQA